LYSGALWRVAAVTMYLPGAVTSRHGAWATGTWI
jgi:hypothetical protein